MPNFFHKGLKYHVATRGDDRKAPLVLLHGFAQSSRTWHEVIDSLAAYRFVVAPDFVGHGKSAKPDDVSLYSFAEMKEWISALIDYFGFDRVDLLGYSMGGRVALLYAISSPEQVASLILESSGMGPSTAEQRETMKQRSEEWIDRLGSQSLEEFINYWENLPIFSSQKQLDDSKRAALHEERRENDVRALACMVEGGGQHLMPDVSHDVLTLQMPLLYIAGKHDTGYAEIAKRLQFAPGITVALLNTGHNTHLEDPQAFVQQVNGFLQEISPSHYVDS